MNKLLMFLSLCVLAISSSPSFAGQHEYKNTPQYQQMEKDTRASLRSCLDNDEINTKQCIEKYKDTRKQKKKELKQMSKG